jgi:class 3 adenylate cyclase/pimeloyl-ACP methyl ester carboxylesterase
MDAHIRYAQSADGTRIGLCTFGSGQPLIVLTNFYVTIDLYQALPDAQDNIERLARKRRVVLYDTRGTGYSSQRVDDFSRDSHVADLEAVVESLGSETVDMLAGGPATLTALAYAATRPNRVRKLVLESPAMKGEQFAVSERLQALLPLAAVDWGMYLNCLALANFGWSEVGRRVAELQGRTAKRGVWREANKASSLDDVSELIDKVACPTLVLLPEESRFLFTNQVPPHRVMEVAAAIQNSRIVKYKPEHAVMLSGSPAYLELFKGFLEESEVHTMSGEASGTATQTGLTVIFFADIVDSTTLTERLGDAAFRDKARELDGSLRTIIRERAGTPIEGKLLGDGVLATFTSARQAIQAALACATSGDDAGLALHLGLHAGDVIREDNNVFGGVVNVAARVSALSTPGEVLVSQTVRDLARTSAGVRFEDRGEQSLKGVGEAVRIWAVSAETRDESGETVT